MFGYHVTGSTGTLFLYGIVVGAVALFGLSLLLGGARRIAHRGHASRRRLKRSRHETAAAIQERDDLIDQRDAGRTDTANVRESSSPHDDRHQQADDGHHGRLHLFGRRAAHR